MQPENKYIWDLLYSIKKDFLAWSLIHRTSICLKWHEQARRHYSASILSKTISWTQTKTDNLRTSGGKQFLLDLGDVMDEVHNTVGISPLIIVPGNELAELAVKHDTGAGIKDT